MDFSLQPARLEDLQAILPWVGTADLLRQWGGPAMGFPATPEAVWAVLRSSAEEAFSLFDPAGDLVGFGQASVHDPDVHLPRLIIPPSRRGQGLGRILAGKLIQEAITHHPGGLALKGYSDQAPAVAPFNSFHFAARPVARGAAFLPRAQPA